MSIQHTPDFEMMKYVETRLLCRSFIFYYATLSKSFLIGVLLNFLATRSHGLVDSFVTFYNGSNWAHFGIVEAFGDNHRLHLISLINFDNKIDRIHIDAVPISELSVKKFLTNVQKYYPDIKFNPSNQILVIDMTIMSASKYREPTRPKIWEYGWQTTDSFIPIGTQKNTNFDFDKFPTGSFDNNVDGKNFGKDFFNTLSHQWPQHVNQYDLDPSVDSFHKYVVGRLMTWLGTTIHHISLDQVIVAKNDDGTNVVKIQQIYYEVRKAFTGKIWKYLNLRTNLRAVDKRSSSFNTPTVFMPSLACYEYSNQQEADNFQVVTFELEGYAEITEPHVTYMKNLENQTTQPLAERIFDDLHNAKFVVGRELRKCLEKSESFDNLAAHIFGQLMIEVEDVEVFELRPKMCRKFGIGDYIFVLKKRFQILIFSVSKRAMNYKNMLAYVKKMYTHHLNTFHICAIGKWHLKKLNANAMSCLENICDPRQQNILYILDNADFVLNIVKQYQPESIVPFYVNFNIFLFRAIPAVNFKQEFLNKVNVPLRDLDSMVHNILQLCHSALEIKDGSMLSFVVQNVLGHVFKIKRSIHTADALLISEKNSHHMSANRKPMTIFKKFAYGTDKSIYQKGLKYDQMYEEQADFHLHTLYDIDKICSRSF